jgi:capsular exopolysaccharide synthesis family protein
MLKVVNLFGKSKQRQKERRSETNDLTHLMPTITEPTSAASEAYRSLRTNLFYSVADDPPRAIVLTSPAPAEGKSTTCSNLAVVMAQAAKNTLILDCDFRRPAIHKFFGLPNIRGLTDVLAGEHILEDVWAEPVEGLKVVPVGPIPLNPTEIIGTHRFSKLLANVRDRFDYVLIDAPPIGLLSDAAILTLQGDGALVVLDAQTTRKGAFRRSMRALETVGAKVLGVVINNAKISDNAYYYDYSDRSLLAET